MKNIFKKGILTAIAFVMVIFMSVFAVKADNTINFPDVAGWPTNTNYQSNQPWIANPNYPDTALKTTVRNGAGFIYSNGDPRKGYEDQIRWNIYMNNNAITGLSKPLGEQSYELKENYTFIDSFNYNPSDVDLDSIYLYTPVFAPTCLDETNCESTQQKGTSTSKIVTANKPFCGTADNAECYYRAGSSVPNNQYVFYNFKEVMTGGEIKQNNGESLKDFASRLPALSYGVYKYEGPMSQASNSLTLVANFGTMGNNGITIDKGSVYYTQNGETKIASGENEVIHTLTCLTLRTNGIPECNGIGANSNSGFAGYMDSNIINYTKLSKYYSDVYGSNNVINGNAPGFIMSLKVKYPEVYATYPNDSKGYTSYPSVNYKVDGQEITKEVKQNSNGENGSTPGQLKPKVMQKATNNQAILFLYDRTYSYTQRSGGNTLPDSIIGSMIPASGMESNEVYVPAAPTFPGIEGATFTLQQKDSNGNWTNYKTNLVTNNEGFVIVDNLPDGNYRFVQDSVQSNDYPYPFDMSVSCQQNITDPNSAVFDSANPVQDSVNYGAAFNVSPKATCQWDSSLNKLVSTELAINDGQGGNFILGNIIKSPFIKINYDPDGGTLYGGTTAKDNTWSSFEWYIPKIGIPDDKFKMLTQDYAYAGYKPTAPTEGVHAGQPFLGWCDVDVEACDYKTNNQANPFTPVMGIPKTATKEYNLKAMWGAPDVKEWNITYVLPDNTACTNNSKGENPETYTEGEGVTSFVDPTIEGYRFEGWYDDANFTNKVESIPTDATGDKTLYAKTSVIEYTITYNTDGGTNNPANVDKYTVEDTFTFLDPTKDGYTFLGWYDVNDTKITNIEGCTSGDLVLTANWEKTQVPCDEYTISFDLQGGTVNNQNTLDDIKGCPGSKIDLPTPEKTGYEFTGWQINGDNVSSPYTVGDADATLTATWSKKEETYTITYVLYGGKNNASNPSTYVAGEGVAKFEEPTLPNGAFIKWYMEKDDIMKMRDSRVSLDDLEEITGLSDKQTGNVTIYARWFVTPVTPKLDTKNSSCEVDHKVIIPKQEGIKFTTTQEGKIVKVKATIENGYKEGYVFADGAKTEWTFDVTNTEKCPTGPGTTNPTNPLPETGSELMVLGLSLITITGIGLVGYRRLSNK